MYTTKEHRFSAYGTWILYEVVNAETGRPVTDIKLVMREAAGVACETWMDLKVVEAQIYFPHDHKYEWVMGYTFSSRIPPHRKDHKDGDARVTVLHHYAINQLEGR